MRDTTKRLEYITDLAMNMGIIKGYDENGVSRSDESYQALAAETNEMLQDYVRYFGEDSASIRVEEELIELGVYLEPAF